ncbi:MAG: ASKHA domain-containing protein [Deltaproteobacteria bacterium]|nr:ASKHA domain-containing protein [Deltaproteobacteria bacterium]
MISGRAGCDIVSCILAARRPGLKAAPAPPSSSTSSPTERSSSPGGASSRPPPARTGPAPVGMDFLCGARALTGAVDSLAMEDGFGFSRTAFGGAPAMGNCGSGLNGINACLVRREIINKAGRMRQPGGRGNHSGPPPGLPALPFPVPPGVRRKAPHRRSSPVPPPRNVLN